MSLELAGVGKEFSEFRLEISLVVRRGELMTILGPSGCGKTTTLRLIAGFIRPDRGTIDLEQERLDILPPQKRSIGLVFQDYALFPHMTVAENIAFGLRMRSEGRKRIEARVNELLSLLHLDEYAKRKVTRLSGGEQQRVALARALAPRPRLLLLDEPLSALDAKLRNVLRAEIRRVQRELDVTTLYVTHDQEEALVLSDRIAVMRDGRIVQVGRPEELYMRPADQWTAGFIGESNLIEGELLHVDGVFARVKTAQGIFKAVASSTKTSHVILFFRPEACRFGPGENSFTGAVTERVYLGESTLLTVQSGALMIKVRSSSDHGTRLGDNVRISVAPEGCRILSFQAASHVTPD